MNKRPLCLMCILFMLGIWLMDLWGIPSVWNSRQNPRVQEYLQQAPSVQISGDIYQYDVKDQIYHIYVNKTNLIINSKIYPIRRVKITYKQEIEEDHYPIGSRVLVTGKIEEVEPPTNPGQFDAPVYYGARKIGYLMKAEKIQIQNRKQWDFRECLAKIRMNLKESIMTLSSTDSSAALCAMLLGDKGELDPESKIRFQMSGISHILAISGLHLSLLGMGLFRVLRKLGAGIPLAGTLSIAGLLSYCILTGGSVATVRAVIMFVLSMTAKIIGRTYDILSALSLAAILLLADSPGYLYDSSFLLSFLAVTGVAGILPLLKKNEDAQGKKKENRKVLFTRIAGTIKAGLQASIAIWLMTLPAVLYFFCEVPIYGVLVNLFVLPTLSIILVSGLIGGTVGMFIPIAGSLLLIPGSFLLQIYNGAGALVQRLPFSTIILGRPSLWQIAIYFAGLTAWVFIKTAIGKEEREARGVKAVGRYVWLAALCLFLVWRPFKGAQITFLDVGQGDGSVIQTVNGHAYLVDGGSSSVSNVGTYRILPFLKYQGIRCLDAVFLSHTDLDHMNGIEELLKMVKHKQTSLRIRCLVLPKWIGEDKLQVKFDELEQLAKDAGCRVVYIKRGDVFESGTIRFTCFHPGLQKEGRNSYEEKTNAGSEVLLMEFGKFKAMFTGDLEGEGEREVAEKLNDKKGLNEIGVLKVAHHGSRNSSSDFFLLASRPKTAVISCGADNSYGHPHTETLERLKQAGCDILQTSLKGAITVITDGNSSEFKTFAFSRKEKDGIMDSR